MERWIPNSYLREGIEKHYSKDYLDALLQTGRLLREQNVPVIFSLAHLANYSRTLYSDLHDFVSRVDDHRAGKTYKNFTISKRSGGVRWISIPCSPLMAVQSWISQEILSGLQPHSAAMAYVKGKLEPLKAHAETHIGAKWVLKVDIKSFFSNISEQQVYGVFKGLGYPNLLSFEMARLCTRITPNRNGKRWRRKVDEDYAGPYFYDLMGSLPQGSPTSPALSNLVCRKMDEDLETLALSHGVTYSRYADDLCFSFLESDRRTITNFKRLVVSILIKYNFEENSKKTRIIPPGSRKIITGIVIDSGKATIPRELRDRIRMHLYYAKKVGIADHCKEKGFRSIIGFRNHLFGLITYASSINPSQGAKLQDEFSRLPWLDFDI